MTQTATILVTAKGNGGQPFLWPTKWEDGSWWIPVASKGMKWVRVKPEEVIE